MKRHWIAPRSGGSGRTRVLATLLLALCGGFWCAAQAQVAMPADPAADPAAANVDQAVDTATADAAEEAARRAAEASPVSVSLLTFAPGDIYWQRFAHNAILLRLLDGRAGVFNYGVFDFYQKNFFLNFARGKMNYRLDVESLYDTIPRYVDEGRWIYEQHLNLDEPQRRFLAAYLWTNLQPENIEYRYDYFGDNCSTRVRDAIDKVLGGALRTQLESKPASGTYRTDVMRLMVPIPALMLGMNLGLGPLVDRPLNQWQDAFLPLNLMQSVSDVRIMEASGTRPLVSRAEWLWKPEGSSPDRSPPPPAPPLLLPFLFAGIAVAASLLLVRALRRFATARALLALITVTVSLIGGLAGVVLAAGWVFSEHWGMWENQNLLLVNPLLLLVAPTWIRSGRGYWYPSAFASAVMQLVVVLAACCPILKLLPVEPQDNWAWIALLLPILLAMGWTLRRAHRSPPIWSH